MRRRPHSRRFIQRSVSFRLFACNFPGTSVRHGVRLGLRCPACNLGATFRSPPELGCRAQNAGNLGTYMTLCSPQTRRDALVLAMVMRRLRAPLDFGTALNYIQSILRPLTTALTECQ
jgi:hypothetical protein